MNRRNSRELKEINTQWSMFIKDIDPSCAAEPSHNFIVEPKAHGIAVTPKGYSDQDGGPPILICYEDGEPVVYCWPDIGSEDPVRISLEAARDDRRKASKETPDTTS